MGDNIKRSTFFKNLASLAAAAFIPFKMTEASKSVTNENGNTFTNCKITNDDPNIFKIIATRPTELINLEPDYGSPVDVWVRGNYLYSRDIVMNNKKIVGMVTMVFKGKNKQLVIIRPIDPYVTFNVMPGEYIKRMASQKDKYTLKSRNQCQDINKNNAP